MLTFRSCLFLITAIFAVTISPISMSLLTNGKMKIYNQNQKWTIILAVSIYTTVVHLILLGYSHDHHAANFSLAIRTTVVQLILLGYLHDFHSQSCRSFLQHVAR